MPPGFGPMMMPPPMMLPPPRPERSFTRAIFLTLATTIFGISLVLNIYLIAWALMQGGGRGSATTKVLLEGDASELVAVVPVSGVIMDEAVETFHLLLRQAENSTNLKAVVIEVDTPGGSVTASDEIHQQIIQFRQRHPGIPVVISMRGLATSGGYFVACAGEYIFARPSTITGNIGVMMPRWNFARLAERWGIEDTSLASSGSPYKTAGSMIQPETPEERAYWQGIIDDAYGQFKAVVTDGRKGRLKVPVEQAADGRAFTANQALEMGLIDQIGYMNDVTAYVQNKVGLNRPHVVRYERQPSLSDLLGITFGGSGGQARSPTVNVNVDARALHELATPRLMYLWRGE